MRYKNAYRPMETLRLGQAFFYLYGKKHLYATLLCGKSTSAVITSSFSRATKSIAKMKTEKLS